MTRVIHLALKDLRLLWREKVDMFWVLGFPMLYAIFFGLIFGGSGTTARSKMDVALIDQDQSRFSQLVVGRLKKSDALAVRETTEPDARERIRRGNLAGALILRKGFGSDLGALVSGQPRNMELVTDPSRQAEAGYLEGIAMTSTFGALRDQMTDRAWVHEQLGDSRRALADDTTLSPSQRLLLGTFLGSLDTFLQNADDSLFRGGSAARTNDGASLTGITRSSEEVKHTGPPSYFGVSFPQAILWALMACAGSFAVSLVQERTRGTLVRLRVAPLSRAQILAGKGLACFTMSVATVALLTLVSVLFFRVQVNSYPLLALAVVCAAACFVGVMMLVCTLGRTEQSVGGAGWACFIIMGMLGGAMVPLFFMPPWMRTLGMVSPVRWGIMALEGATWRHFTPAEMLAPCAVLVATGVLFFVAGALVLRRSER